ncbi:MAG: metal ABC transporter permease [Gemmatimonadetes bacterium]|nr:metal ABC transporter permease [Gemmatimonadota bacterium]
MIETLLLFREALYGAIIIGVACAVLGVYVVLRRIVFVGAALAQLSSAGIALALWLGGLGLFGTTHGHLIGMSLLLTLAGALFFGLGGGRRYVHHEAVIGVTYAASAAVGILLIAKAASGEGHDIFLQGNVLGMSRHETVELLAVVIPILGLHAALAKEFVFVSFDPETAATLGYRVVRWNLLLYFTIGIVIAFAMQSAGVLLVFNFLVVPAVTGVLIGRTIGQVFAVSIAAAVLAAAVGFGASIPLDLPTGPAIAAVSALLALLAWSARRLRRE